jgi:hypothetical protein
MELIKYFASILTGFNIGINKTMHVKRYSHMGIYFTISIKMRKSDYSCLNINGVCNKLNVSFCRISDVDSNEIEKKIDSIRKDIVLQINEYLSNRKLAKNAIKSL